MAFSFISITTGIFTTYAFALATGGTRSIWTWPIVVAGQSLVALVYGALSARVPLSGYSYQWASRLASTHVGWWFGWMSFAFLTIVTVSVDYGLVQVAFQPLIGETYTPTSATLETLVVLALQAAFIITSTRVTTRVNNAAVATEVIGIVGLTVLLRLLRTMQRLAEEETDRLDLPTSRYDIADYLALSVETVSRSLSDLKHRGLISLAGPRRVQIVDRRGLDDRNKS